MDSLVSKRSVDEFWRNTVMLFVLYGLGTVREVLDMRIWEIQETLMSAKDKDWQKAFMALHGLQTK